MTTLVALSARANRIALMGAMLAVLAMLCASLWQVVARYLLDTPPIWTEELARRAMVWAGMLGASCAFYEKSDPVLFTQMRDRQGRLGLGLSMIRALGVLIFAVPVIWYAFFSARGDFGRGFLGRSLARQAEMLDVSMIWFTAAVPVAFLLITLHLLARLSCRILRTPNHVDPV